MDECRLIYRRQFLLSREPITQLSYWNHFELRNKSHLYVHPDLNVCLKECPDRQLVLIGYIFDYQGTTKTDEDIIDDIMAKIDSFGSLVKILKRYAGQYAIIYINREVFNIIHDALGLREIYYCQSVNRVICGSQPNLLKEFGIPRITLTQDKNKKKFYEHDMKKVRAGRLWVGDETYFENVKHLLPNHYLDIRTLETCRYWPNEKIQNLELNVAVDLACNFLRGILKAACNRHDLMMAVTAGTDTRTLLAASKDIKDKIYYFINKHKSLSDRHPDIYVPKAIFQALGLPFHIHELDREVDEMFRNIFLNNVFMASELRLSVIYNVYFKQHSHRLNILGVGEIGRSFFGRRPKNLNGYFLARALKYKDSLYAIEKCQEWLDRTLPAAEEYGVDIMTLLYWEQHLGNWGVVGNSESDIAIEEFDPFNSHYLYETLLGVNKKFTKYGHNILFKEMIRNMWPVLIEFPINPPYRFYDRLRNWLIKYNLFDPIRNLVYKIDWLKFKVKQIREREL